MKYENTYHIMKMIGEDLVIELKSLLQQEGKDATGDLINSIDYQLVETEGGWEVEIISLDYLQNVDEGRSPGLRPPPPSAIIPWIQSKGIVMTNKNGGFISEQSAGFLIARSIGEKGIQPTNVIDRATSVVLKRYEDKLSDAIADDYLIELKIEL